MTDFIMDKQVHDYYGQEINIGDRVAASTLSYKRAHLRVGEVTNISENGIVSILQMDGIYSKVNFGSNIVILNRGESTRTKT